MKRCWRDGFDRRSFLTSAATAVAGVAIESRIGSRAYADAGLLGRLDDRAAVGGTTVMDSDQLIQKKVCMLGAPSVGKTSLVRRYVESMYGDNYLDTVGVKIDKKVIDIGGRKMVILLWDIIAESDFQSLRTSYLRGASGIMLVVDGTRRGTLDVAIDLNRRINEGVLGSVPSVMLVFNKDDLSSQWEVHNSEIASLAAQGVPVLKGSAKTGNGVEDSFLTLASNMIKK